MMHSLNTLPNLLLLAGTCFWMSGAWVSASDFEDTVIPFLDNYCLECHDDLSKKGDLDLYRFFTESDVMAERATWASVFEKVESHQMPPPKEVDQPSPAERAEVLAWISDIAARPDPELGIRDPGKPVMRRLTRLEYNNTVRDLFGLDVDVFIFPERLNFANRTYYQSASGNMGRELQVSMREYGGRYRVLVPQAGLPGDNRAAHGFRNRGETMDFSPLLFEKYVQLAGDIVQAEELPVRSPKFASLLGLDPQELPALAKPQAGGQVSPVVGQFAPDLVTIKKAEDSALWPEDFRKSVEDAYRIGRGGVMDIAGELGGQTIAGKGGLMRAEFGQRVLTINPNEDLWMVGFNTTTESSGPLLLTNKEKGSKVFELTFRVLQGGGSNEGVEQLGLCVLGRRGQSGVVVLKAVLSDGTEMAVEVAMEEGESGTRFVALLATPGETIRALKVDGSRFSGDYVLLDDIGFVTTGPSQSAESLAEWHKRLEDPQPQAAPSQEAALKTKPVPKEAPKIRLASFLEDAFRRPVSDSEIDRFFLIYEKARSSGKNEADAMRTTIQAVLSSPSFLFFEMNGSQSAKGPVAALDDFALANRLSYFLWSTIPDEELYKVARAGQLTLDPHELERQVRRMLRDPKSKELSESFAYQWLRLDQLYSSKPDRDLFKKFYSGPQGKATLHASALVEPLLLFETILAEDRSILDLIDPDFGWLNDQLVDLYGIEESAQPQIQEIKGPAAPSSADEDSKNQQKRGEPGKWYRIALPDSTRGGVLTMSGPLTVTSFPFRTSPVKRGAWLLETVFNRPPTEPKVAFVIEDDTKESAQSMSVREKFEAHRTEAACYSCHVRLDPPGFALESFDPIGVWRTIDGGMPVDAGGEWNGQSFEGPAEFKKILAETPHEFTRGFIEHLLSYALSRKLEIYDMPVVQEIQAAAEAEGWKFSRVIVEIAKSYPFTHTRLATDQPGSLARNQP